MTEPDFPPQDGAAAPAPTALDPAGEQGLGELLAGDPALPPEGSDQPPVDAPIEPAPKRPSYVFLAVVSLLSVVADIGTKLWAEKTLVIGPQEVPTPKVIIKGVFTFFLAKNRGGAWGFLQHQPEKVRKPFFVLVSVLAIALLVGLYRRVHPEQRALKWGLPLVFGGAVGNLVDRIRYGHVIDFIDIQATWKGTAHHWPTFNVADIAICVGVALMAVDMFTPRRDAVVPPPDEEAAPVDEVAPPAPLDEMNKPLDEEPQPPL